MRALTNGETLLAARAKLIKDIDLLAGHGSVAMNTVAPSAVLFIPSVDGVSHCKREFSTDADMVAGVAMPAGAARELTRGVLAGAVALPAEAVA